MSCRPFAAVCVAVAMSVGSTPAAEQAVAGAAVYEALQSQERTGVVVVFSLPRSVTPLQFGRLDTPDARADIRATGQDILADLAPDEFHLRYQYRSINALAGDVSESGLARLLDHSSVLRVDLDERTYAMLSQAVPLSRLDLVQDQGFTGQGVTVAVIDTGYDTNHPDLLDDLVEERCFCSFGGGCCPNGQPTQTGPGSAEDGNGHGTNVSGIITSAGIIAPEGGAPNAGIVALKTLSDGGVGNVSDDIAALDFIITQQTDVDLVNMSLGTGTLFSGECDQTNAVTQAYAAAFGTLRASNVRVFAASGNESSGSQMPAPACVADAISVGAVYDANIGGPINFSGCTDATTAADKVTCFSNSNATTDLFAPGGPTTSAGVGGGTSTFFGTSQASPLATACAALLLEADPTATAEELEAALNASPTFVTDATNGLSFPRVDCKAALDVLLCAIGDADQDGVCDDVDNCPDFANQKQGDSDADDLGDACDNCPDVANAGQENFDNDPFGDACEVGALVSDVNNSARVDGFDVAALAMALGSQVGQPNYSRTADLNRDNFNDGMDLDILTQFFGLDTE